MIVSIHLNEHEYLIKEPQVLNFGGKYLYSYIKIDENNLIVRRSLNEKFIPHFFDISNTNSKVSLLSAIVGQNGVGKSSVLDIIRKIFVEHEYSMPYNDSTVLVEVNEEVKVLSSKSNIYLLTDNTIDHFNTLADFAHKSIDLLEDNAPEGYKKLEIVPDHEYQSIYYSPHFDLKYSENFDEVDKYDISLDQFIKQDLEDTDKKGTNENGWRFPLHEELIFKNSMRQIEFLNSLIFKENPIFREVFDLPQYKTGILYLRDVEIPDFHNTPNPLRPIIRLILEKVENESRDWHIFRDQNSKLDKSLRQALVNKYLLERFVIKSFISVVILQMEKANTWLQEGKIENPHNMDRFKDTPAIEVLFYFIKESYIEKGDFKKTIFDYNEILPFFEKLDSLLAKETNQDNISKQSIRLNLDEVKDILQLHKKIVINLLHYYPTREGLVGKGDYTDGFISFRPTDRNMSSGENALLNFYSKLYSFIQNNLVEESKSLPDKENYILLLDEADLGFHPIWKKRYVDAILKTLPYFFESLEVKPKLQIIITTHDPLTLSDLPINNVVFLKKDDRYFSVISDTDQNKIQKTFGANITDLFSHSFFVDNGLIGDFSKSKIKEVIDWINRGKELSDTQKLTKEFTKNMEYYKKVVNLIDEKVVKLKLTEMITDLIPDDDYYNEIIDKEIELLISKKK